MTEEEVRKGFEEVWCTRRRQRLVFGIMGAVILLLAVWKVIDFLPPGSTVAAVNEAITTGVESFCKQHTKTSDAVLTDPTR
jgi:hypothetical protein